MKDKQDVSALPPCNRHLNLGDTCDKCEKGIMRAASARKNKFVPNKHTGKQEAFDYTQFMECSSCGHFHRKERTALAGTGGLSAVVERSRDADLRIEKDSEKA